MLAHELRNPLAPISTATAILERSEGDPATTKWVQGVLRRQLVHLTRLLDDLLDASRVTRGKIVLKKEPLLLREIIEAAVDETRPIVMEREHELTVTLPRNDLHVVGDQVRLTQVVCNLVHNAAKFTPPGGSVAISAEGDGESISLRVVDTGPGISPDALPRVFDLFSQGDDSLSRSAGGLGIGLTVVRSIVEMHGGTVSVESGGPDGGSTFTVRLPASARRETTDAEVEADARAHRMGSGRRIVLVDDNIDATTAMGILLELAGHHVEVAHDGLKGLECIIRTRPEVVICDIGLPGIDGYEVARRVRQELANPPVIIAITGYGQLEDHERSRSAGFAAHMVKPVDPDRLLERIEMLVSGPAGHEP